MKTKSKSSTKVRRVSRENVRANAKAGGRGRLFIKLPKGVERWRPEKAATVQMNILPYLVSTDKHPDGIEKGMLWYKFPFQIHRNVGPANDAVVCPGSVGKKCPICEQRAKLAKNWDENEDAIKALNVQKFVAFNMVDPEDDDKTVVFAESRGKFAAPLDKELAEGDESNLNFYDVDENGRTLKVRFSEDTFDGRKFFEATRIDFRERAEMDLDATLARVVCLDDILEIMSYEDLKKMFLQIDEGDDEEEEDEDDTPKKGKKKAAKPADDEDDDDEEEDSEDENDETEDEDDDDEEEPETKAPAKKAKHKYKKGDRVTATIGKKKVKVKISDIDGDDVEVVDADGETHNLELDDIAPLQNAAAPDKKKAKEDEDGDDDDDEEGDSGDEDEEEADEEDDDDDTEGEDDDSDEEDDEDDDTDGDDGDDEDDEEDDDEDDEDEAPKKPVKKKAKAK